MSRVATLFSFLASLALFAIPVCDAQGAIASEKLLPDTTKGYVSVPSIDQLRTKWRETQLGQMAHDPAMKPFADDLRAQLRAKLEQNVAQIGLTWEDVDAVHNGEVCLAMIQPGGDPTKHAVAVLIDVTDRADATDQLLAKVAANMKERGASQRTRKAGDTIITAYSIPDEKDKSKQRQVFLFVKQQMLVAVSDENEAVAIVARLDGKPDAVLAQLPAFQLVIERCEEATDIPPLARWFVEPLGYAHAMRALAGGKTRRGKDRLKILSEQGFGAVQGAGGHINFATDQYELLHRTFVYAPPVDNGEDGAEPSKYRLAARMLDFPNHREVLAQDWIPRELATYVTFNWRMKEAFDYSETIVDAYLGEGFFDDFLASLREDINGPQIDIRKELVAHLGQRATVFSDNIVPITPDSERIMLGLELTDFQAVAQNLDRALQNDPHALKQEINGHTVWELLNEDEEEMPIVVIDGIGLTPIPGLEDTAAAPEAEIGEEPRILENAAIAVVHGHLIVTSQLDLMKRIVTQDPQDQLLNESMDYKIVNQALESLGAGEDSFRGFSRTDEEYRATYELVRQNRMPEAKTLVGRVLNQLLGSDEEGVLRQQQINGEKLPDYQVVRRYLGPGGIYVRSVDDGWMISGIMLSKDQAYDAAFERPTVATASAKTD